MWHREAAPLPSRRPAQPGPPGPLKCQGGSGKKSCRGLGMRVEAWPAQLAAPGARGELGTQAEGVRAAGTGTPPP